MLGGVGNKLVSIQNNICLFSQQNIILAYLG